MTTITIKRERMVNARPGMRPPGWCYSFTTPVDVTYNYVDGTSRPGPRAGAFITYGKGLDDLRDYLHGKYGRDVTLIETWQAAR